MAKYRIRNYYDNELKDVKVAPATIAQAVIFPNGKHISQNLNAVINNLDTTITTQSTKIATNTNDITIIKNKTIPAVQQIAESAKQTALTTEKEVKTYNDRLKVLETIDHEVNLKQQAYIVYNETDRCIEFHFGRPVV